MTSVLNENSDYIAAAILPIGYSNQMAKDHHKNVNMNEKVNYI